MKIKILKLHLVRMEWLCVILIISIACTPLPEEDEVGNVTNKAYSVEEALEIVANENDVARTLYTKAIVGAGKQKGLSFHEDWTKDQQESGPLPALFLRAISSDIQKKGEVPLGLFLGSDFPVRKSNKFIGKQAELFEKIREDGKPKFFFDEENQLYTAMFPDYAVAQPCVGCHNDHPETMKSDWKLGDIMGATTWTYPEDSVSVDELKAIINAFRDGAKKSYAAYLDKIETFKTAEKPTVGQSWPAEAFEVPTAEIFIDSVNQIAAANTLKSILEQ